MLGIEGYPKCGPDLRRVRTGLSYDCRTIVVNAAHRFALPRKENARTPYRARRLRWWRWGTRTPDPLHAKSFRHCLMLSRSVSNAELSVILIGAGWRAVSRHLRLWRHCGSPRAGRRRHRGRHLDGAGASFSRSEFTRERALAAPWQPNGNREPFEDDR